MFVGCGVALGVEVLTGVTVLDVGGGAWVDA
jgi:hypothetical protein